MACDVNQLLRDGADFQRLSQREQWIVIAELLCEISQTGPPWAIVYPTGFAVGPNGVINTTGTTTSGIQEAINSLPASSGNTTIGGGMILLAFGVFSCSTSITFPSQFPYDVRLLGMGKLATQLLFTGTGDFVKSQNTAADGFRLRLDSIGLFYQQDTQLASIISLQPYNELHLYDCMLAPYQCRNGARPSAKVGTIGVSAADGTYKGVFHFCDFFGLAAGVNMPVHHLSIRESKFSTCGKFGGGAGSVGNLYTAPDPLATGFAIRSAGSETTISDCLVLDNAVGVANFNDGLVAMHYVYFEDNTFDVVTDGTFGGNVYHRDGNFPASQPFVTGKWDSGTGIITAGGALGVIQDLLYGNGNVLETYWQGNLVFRITPNGAQLPNMTKAQRNAIFAPALGLAIFQTDNTPGQRVWNGTNWMRYTETID